MFAGHIAVETNVSSTETRVPGYVDTMCTCKLSGQRADQDHRTISRLNEITTNRFFQSGSLDITSAPTCSSNTQCRDRRGVSLLHQILEASSLEDLEHLSLSSLDLDSAENQVATVKVIGGPILPRPQDGWTASEADKFCEDFIKTNDIVSKCVGLPGVDVLKSLKNCRNDVQVR